MHILLCIHTAKSGERWVETFRVKCPVSTRHQSIEICCNCIATVQVATLDRVFRHNRGFQLTLEFMCFFTGLLRYNWYTEILCIFNVHNLMH